MAKETVMEQDVLESKQEEVILRLQAELRRTLEKPIQARHWVMVIDLRKCVGWKSVV